MEADLLHHYQVDLGDLFTGRLTWRRLKVLVVGLPRTSNFAHAVLGEAALWGPTDHLLAAVFDAVNVGNWQRGGGRRQRPKPLQRPGRHTIGDRSMTPAQVDRLVERHRISTAADHVSTVE